MSDREDPPSQPVSVFISHVAADEAWANWITDRLRAMGATVVLPRDAAPAGADAVQSVKDALSAAGQVVLIVSQQSSGSSWVRAEISLAQAAGKRVIPVRVDRRASMPPELVDIAYLDFTGISPATAGDRISAALRNDMEAEAPSADRGPSFDAPLVQVDRHIELSQLDATFFSLPSTASAPAVVLVGPAGIGKSALARQFVETRKERFSSVQWMSTMDSSTRSNLPEIDVTDNSAKYRLVVVEDVADYHAIAQLLPADRRTAVLLTSRNTSWGPPFVVLRVTELTDQAAAEFLRRLVPGLPAADAAQIRQAVGGTPLALRLVASLIRNQSVESVLETLRALKSSVGTAEEEQRGFYYLDTDDPNTISEFERAFSDAVSRSDGIVLYPPEHGSWRRRWARRYSEDRVEQIHDKAERAVEVASLVKPEGEANRNNAEAIARLLEASDSIPNMVVASGSVLLIKVTDESGARVFSKTLTATELRRFEENQHLLSQPSKALAFLGVLGSEPSPVGLESTSSTLQEAAELEGDGR